MQSPEAPNLVITKDIPDGIAAMYHMHDRLRVMALAAAVTGAAKSVAISGAQRKGLSQYHEKPKKDAHIIPDVTLWCHPIGGGYDVRIKQNVFICNTCGKIGKKLSKCGQCSHAHYCDKKCSAADWKAHKAFCRSIKNQKEADKTNPNIKRGPDEVILFFKLMYRECLQLERPHLVKFWLGVLIRHLRSDEPLMVRHALTTLVWFFWHFTCFALPRYLVRPFQEAVCLISERVAEGTPPGLARMPDPLVNSPFRHLPDTPPLREKVVSMNNRFVAMMQLIKRDECGMRVVCPPGMFQGPSDAASVAAGKEDVLDAVLERSSRGTPMMPDDKAHCLVVYTLQRGLGLAASPLPLFDAASKAFCEAALQRWATRVFAECGADFNTAVWFTTTTAANGVVGRRILPPAQQKQRPPELANCEDTGAPAGLEAWPEVESTPLMNLAKVEAEVAEARRRGDMHAELPLLMMRVEAFPTSVADLFAKRIAANDIAAQLVSGEREAARKAGGFWAAAGRALDELDAEDKSLTKMRFTMAKTNGAWDKLPAEVVRGALPEHVRERMPAAMRKLRDE